MIGYIARAKSCRDIILTDFRHRIQSWIKVEIRMTNENCLKVLYYQFQNSKIAIFCLVESLVKISLIDISVGYCARNRSDHTVE